MTKKDIIVNIAEETGISQKDVTSVVEGVINEVKKAFNAGETIEIRGFGTFKKTHRAERVARNIQTGATVTVPAKDVLVFKPSKNFPE